REARRQPPLQLRRRLGDGGGCDRAGGRGDATGLQQFATAERCHDGTPPDVRAVGSCPSGILCTADFAADELYGPVSGLTIHGGGSNVVSAAHPSRCRASAVPRPSAASLA